MKICNLGNAHPRIQMYPAVGMLLTHKKATAHKLHYTGEKHENVKVMTFFIS